MHLSCFLNRPAEPFSTSLSRIRLLQRSPQRLIWPKLIGASRRNPLTAPSRNTVCSSLGGTRKLGFGSSSSDLAYLDRNANRDLTDDGEGLEVKPGNEEARRAKLGEIKPAAGKNAYRIVYLDLERIWVQVRDGFVQYAPLSYADRPEDAPIFHFDGPLALMPNPEDIKHGLIRGNQVNQFRVLVGTRTSDKGVVFVECDQGFPDKRFRVPASGFPGGLHPVVDIEFPGRVKGDKSIQRTFPFDQRC
jgi:hypothetical protein